MINGSKRSIDAAAVTDVGRRRRMNEDNYCIDQKLGMFVVADGMGGHDAGEVASQKTAAAIQKSISRFFVDAVNTHSTLNSSSTRQATPNREDNNVFEARILAAAVRRANDEVFGCNQQRGYREGQGMGSTVAGVWIPGDSRAGFVFHVGDCRVYLYRNNTLSLLTRDHTLYQEWKDRGGDGTPPRKNIILRAVGPWQNVEADVSIWEFLDGDTLLICSDGLTDMLEGGEIEEELRDIKQSTLSNTCRRLVQRANDNGGIDNITAMLVGLR